MSGTAEGGRKARDKNLANNPDFYKIAGHLGGIAKVPKGFSKMPKAKIRAAGSLGGKNSRHSK